MLQSVGSQRVGHELGTEQQQQHLCKQLPWIFNNISQLICISVTNTPFSQCRGPKFDPWSGTRTHTLQLGPSVAK